MPTRCHENVCERSINASLTQIDTARFGKPGALTSYSKGGKHKHVKHLWSVLGFCQEVSAALKTSMLTIAPKFPLGVSVLCQTDLPKFWHLTPPHSISLEFSQTQTNSARQSSGARCYFH